MKQSGKVVQDGTQLRSTPSAVAAREVDASGRLGNISRIEQRRNRRRPFWYEYIPDVKSKDVHWVEFVMGCSSRTFDPIAYSAWMGYRDFCDRLIPQLGVHFLDTVHFITAATLPESYVCHGGTLSGKMIIGSTFPIKSRRCGHFWSVTAPIMGAPETILLNSQAMRDFSISPSGMPRY